MTNLQSVILFHVCGVYGDLDLAPNKILNEQSAQVCPWIYTSRVQRAILEKLTTIYLSNIIGDLQR